ncbi:MAG: UvrD-helicase domain-containing protein [Methanomethylophilus sp.]|jgi:DNA helicase-4
MLRVSAEVRKRIVSQIEEAEKGMQDAIPEGRFIDKDEADGLKRRYGPPDGMEDALRSPQARLHLLNRDFVGRCEEFQRRYAAFLEEVYRHNSDYEKEIMPAAVQRDLPVEGRMLDGQQMHAIVCDVRNRLVIAGAGTGKTTTVVGLVKDIVLSGKAAPEEILLLSFTNASVDELAVRVKKETGKDVRVSTFHRLGMSILTEVEGKRPRITDIEPRKFIRDRVSELLSDGKYARALERYLEFESFQGKDDSDFASAEDLERYLAENPLLTAAGEKVKSRGELEIADFLHSKGIPYRYEENYKEDLRDREHGQYKPDFHLSGTDIYIEYFGIDRQGNVAPWFSSKTGDPSAEYRASMEWKRKVHSEHGTKLIELYAYERSEGTLLDSLEEKLRKEGVEMPSLSDSEIAEGIRGSYYLSAIVSQMATSLSLMRGTGKPFDEAYPKVRIMGDRRLSAFRDLFRPVYESYVSALREDGAIDFSDMLNMAADYVRGGRYRNPYRYVVVDEYQDIAAPAFRLLKALRESSDYHLFCVGDDWQSIYRFNGSDVGYIMDFESYWGGSEICRIERTYRNSGILLEESGRFIMKNPRQVKKHLRGGDGDAFLRALWVPPGESICPKLCKRLEKLPHGSSVLLLGRYTFDEQLLQGPGLSAGSAGEGPVKLRARPDLDIRFMTVHRSKGLQADYVFIVNCRGGRMGFPNGIEDSPLVDYLTNGREDYPYAEERRLFYVAMTRARKGTYLVVSKNNMSPFAKEVLGEISGRGPGGARICPECGAPMVIRKGKYGKFWGCTRYPKCNYTENIKFSGYPVNQENRRR